MNTQISSAKSTIFSGKRSLNCRGNLIIFEKPLIMGILNITPDSFYDGGRYNSVNKYMQHTAQMLQDGADIIDIGAASTRPETPIINTDEEIQRLLPALKNIRKEFSDIFISVDTYHSKIAEVAIDNGADIINDISGGTFDDNMFNTIGKLKVPYVLMHIKGTPDTMQKEPVYDDVVKEVIFYFSERINKLRSLGVNDIIIDPGFGFGKTIAHNYEILSKLDLFKVFDVPIVAGVSRKSMINKVLNCKPEDALNGTTVLNTVALLKGASILRVHDVKEAMEALKLCRLLAV